MFLRLLSCFCRCGGGPGLPDFLQLDVQQHGQHDNRAGHDGLGQRRYAQQVHRVHDQGQDQGADDRAEHAALAARHAGAADYDRGNCRHLEGIAHAGLRRALARDLEDACQGGAAAAQDIHHKQCQHRGNARIPGSGIVGADRVDLLAEFALLDQQVHDEGNQQRPYRNQRKAAEDRSGSQAPERFREAREDIRAHQDQGQAVGDIAYAVG